MTPDVAAGHAGTTTHRAIMRPGQGTTPFHALAAALLARDALPALEDPKGLGSLATKLSAPTTAVALIEQALPNRARLVLVVDQLEELFTARELPREQRERFLDVVSALARCGCASVLATLRSDFYPHLQRSPVLRALAIEQPSGIYDLGVPSAAEIGQIIRHPARLAGLKYGVDPATNESLAEVLERETAATPDALPLLQFVLEQLHERRDGITLTHAACEELGGLEGAIASRAEEVFGEVSEAGRRVFEPVMRRLVEIGSEGEASRRYAPKAAVLAIPGAEELVTRFVDARLFTSDRHVVGEAGNHASGDGHAVVSIAHEALLRRWKRLLAWLDEDRALLAIRSRVEAGAAQWLAAGRERSLLLPSGRPLAEARSLLTEGVDLGANERAYIAASERRGRALARLKQAAVWVICVLAIGAGVLAWVARRAQATAEGATRRAEREQTKTSLALKDVLRLADAKKIRDLIEEEARLWPIHPDTAPRKARWIATAEAMLG